jgi:hypothetical protein
LSRENRQTRQTCDHIKKHSTMTKQDRAMRFSRCSSSNSLLESSTCRAPLGRSNGGLFWTFGNFPDSPCKHQVLSAGVHKSQVPGRYGDSILYGGNWYLWVLSVTVVSFRHIEIMSCLLVSEF